jgi:hypothetical protein
MEPPLARSPGPAARFLPGLLKNRMAFHDWLKPERLEAVCARDLKSPTHHVS